MSVRDLIAEVLRTKAASLVQKSPEMMSKIIGSSFVYVTSRGTRLDKAQYIDRIRKAPTDRGFDSQEFEDLQVIDFETFAVATMTLHDRFFHPGGTTDATYRSLCVFRKEGAAWLWVAGQTMAPETGPRD